MYMSLGVCMNFKMCITIYLCGEIHYPNSINKGSKSEALAVDNRKLL